MPELGPFPFFYWYQFIWVPSSAVILWICYLLLKTKPTRTRGQDMAGGRGKMSHLNAVTLIIVLASFLIVTAHRLRLSQVAPGRGPDAPE